LEKSEVLKNIRVARRGHIVWVDRAKALVHGLEVKKNDIPIGVTECEFGKWLYCDGQILLSIFSEHAVKKLDKKHKELHDIYMKIFKIYFSVGKRSWLDRLFNRKKRVMANEEYNSLVYLGELEKISEELISYMNIIEKKLNTISEERFKNFH